MFERIQKPFLTVDTGEAYQPIRLTYLVTNKKRLVEKLNEIQCLEKRSNVNSWDWYWNHECEHLHFESIDSFKKNPQHATRLGTFTLRNNALYLNLPSFKRACLALPFFHKQVGVELATIHHADFINKVFGTDERLPHGFTELFKEEELEKIVKQRVSDYEKVLDRCEHAETAEEAFVTLSDYANSEAHKRLPYAERYEFKLDTTAEQDPDVLFLGFYIFLRSRELVAIRRWFGNVNYTMSDAAEESIASVFGDMDIDIIE